MSLSTKIVDGMIRRAKRTPYFHLKGYMGRWWLFRLGPRSTEGQPSWLGGRIHHIIRSDDDRACHCHPWPYVSIILKGGYWEIREFPFATNGAAWDAYWKKAACQPRVGARLYKRGDEWILEIKRWHGPGSILFRRSTDRHRLELKAEYPSMQYGTSPVLQPCWSLFITGPKRKSWFFYTENGPVNWRDYPPAVEDNVTTQLKEWQTV
jgi:hypothetical protein